MSKLNKQQGVISILGLIILAGIVILALSYFNISIKSVVESPTGQENINYVGGGAVNLWTTYFAGPASYIWNDVIVNIFWKGFINNMERIRDGKPTNIEEAAPQLNFGQ